MSVKRPVLSISIETAMTRVLKNLVLKYSMFNPWIMQTSLVGQELLRKTVKPTKRAIGREEVPSTIDHLFTYLQPKHSNNEEE